MQCDTDVLIVGGGLAGCIAATCLRKGGARTQVIDRFAEPPDEFRAEQIVGPQLDKLREFGLLAAVQDARASHTTGNYYRGTLIDRTAVEQYGLPYQAMLRAARAALQPEQLVVARALRIETGRAFQTVHLAGGRQITARLVVLATGLAPQLAKSLGITWTMKSEAHSLCLGFGVELAIARRIDQVIPLTYYRENVRDRIDYLALFQMGGGVRANLFSYNHREDAWVRAFVDRPEESLRAAMPGLSRIIGAWKVVGPVELRKNDIKVATKLHRDGIVLIGDAFQTPCPAAGHGIDRILSDVGALERRVPGWLATDGVGAEYYSDPVKLAFDAECLRVARYRRDVSTRTGIRWSLHRSRVDSLRRLKWLTLKAREMGQRRALKPSIADGASRVEGPR